LGCPVAAAEVLRNNVLDDEGIVAAPIKRSRTQRPQVKRTKLG
jgi:hypothetical protein